MSQATVTQSSSRARFVLIVMFAAVYIIWGSTYLAIRFSIESMPPLLMIGVRFTVGGLLFLVFSSLQGTSRASIADWKAAALSGTFMILGGTGLVSIAEQWVASSLAALAIAAVPMWLVLFDWFRPGGERPDLRVVAGLVLGILGVFLLLNPGKVIGSGGIDLIGGVLLISATVLWAIGSLVSRYGSSSASHSQMLGLKMLLGGLAAIVAAFAIGETDGYQISSITMKSLLALLYQIVFGSLAFGAYLYLLRNTTPAKAGTYAYVNPVIAVILGLTLGNEAISGQGWLAMVVILTAVILITTFKHVAKEDEKPAERELFIDRDEENLSEDKVELT